MTLVRHTAASALEAFRGWVALALPTLTTVRVAKQNIADARRPGFPYAAVQRVGGRDLATPYRRVGAEDFPADPDGATNVLELTRVREITVQVAIYGDDAPDLCESLPMCAGELPSQEYLSAQGISVRTISDMLDERELRDTTHEAWAAQEYGVVYTLEKLSQVGTIETVDTMGYTDLPVE